MREREFNRLMKKLDNIQKSVGTTLHIIKEKSAAPKYPDLFSLEKFTQSQKVECNREPKYNCYSCDTKKRNRCWANANRVDKRKSLIGGIPYTRDALGEMKIANLWIIASHLEVMPTRRTKSSMVDVIIKKQYEMAEEKQKEIENKKQLRLIK